MMLTCRNKGTGESGLRGMMGASVDEKGNGDEMKGVRIKRTFYVGETEWDNSIHVTTLLPEQAS
jgi:hypothetical protein